MNIDLLHTISHSPHIPSESKCKRGLEHLFFALIAKNDLHYPLERPMTPSRLKYTLHLSSVDSNNESFQNFISSLHNQALAEQIYTSVRLYHWVARHSPLLNVFNYLTSSLFFEINELNPTNLFRGPQEFRDNIQNTLDSALLITKSSIYYFNFYHLICEQAVADKEIEDEQILKNTLTAAKQSATTVRESLDSLKKLADNFPFAQDKDINNKVKALRNSLKKIDDFAQGLIKLAEDSSFHPLILSSTMNVISSKKKFNPINIQEEFNKCQKVIVFELETKRISRCFEQVKNSKRFDITKDTQHPGPNCEHLLKQIKSLNLNQPAPAGETLLAISKPFYQSEAPDYAYFLSVLGTNTHFSLLKKVIEQKSAQITLKKGDHYLNHFTKLRMLLNVVSPIWRRTVQNPQHIRTLLEEQDHSEKFQELIEDAKTHFLYDLEIHMESLRIKFDMEIIEKMDCLIGNLLSSSLETYRYVELLNEFQSFFINNLSTEIISIYYKFNKGIQHIKNKYKDPEHQKHLDQFKGTEEFVNFYFSGALFRALELFTAAKYNTPIEPIELKVDNSLVETSEESTDSEEEMSIPESKEEIEEIPLIKEDCEIKAPFFKEQLKEKESAPNIQELLRGNLESHKFLKLLKDLGCKPIRHGKHLIYQSEEGKTFPVPYHPKQGMNKNLAISILKNVLEEK